jgi:hypothetical protein
MSREFFERKCREHGGDVIDGILCRLQIEGIEWPFDLGISATADYKRLIAKIYLPQTPAGYLSKRGLRIFESKTEEAGLSHSYPIRSWGTYIGIIYADMEDFDKLVSVLKEIGREFKALFGRE